jgi:type II secretory pathway component PulM
MISRAALADAWYRRSAGERTALAVLAVLVAVAIIVFVVIVPLTGAVARTRADTLRIEALLAAARADHGIDAALARSAHAPVADTTVAPATRVARALAGQGLVPLAPPRSSADGSVDVIVSAAPFGALVRTLDTLARHDDLHVERAVLARLADGHALRAELTLRAGAAR